MEVFVKLYLLATILQWVVGHVAETKKLSATLISLGDYLPFCNHCVVNIIDSTQETSPYLSMVY